jgi:sarcosine oxidase
VPEHFDVIVIGVGAMGSSACYHLAKRGLHVLGLEQFSVPNAMGSSHGISRMIRAAYYEEPRYVPLLRRAYDLWRELEAATGKKLLYQTGGAFIGPGDGMLVKDSLLAARAHGLEHELIAAPELRQRLPVFHIPDDWSALFDPMAGFLLCESAVEAFAGQAKANGATILTGQKVRGWHAGEKRVVVETDGQKYEADHLILTAGAWTSQLLGELNIELTVTRQILGWVKPIDPRPFELGKFPVWGIDSLDGGIYYGFPIVPEAPGLKLAHHLPGEPFDPNQPTRQPRDTDEADFRPVLQKYIPSANGPIVGIKICLYTNSQDHHFIIDTHPKFDRVSIACAFSGHGFKFASVVGEILARRTCDGMWDMSVDFLRLKRL